MRRRVVVHNAPNKSVYERALQWGKSLSEGFTKLAPGEVINHVVAPVVSPPGFLIRVREDRVDVFMQPQDAPLRPPQGVFKPPVKYRKLAHGVFADLKVELPRGDDFSTGKPLMLYDADKGFVARECWQLTDIAGNHRATPAGHLHSIDNLPARNSWSHFIRLKPSMYSGLMRSVVQAAMAIGWGAEPPLKDGKIDPEQEDLRLPSFVKVLYNFQAHESDGCFIIERSEPVEYAPGRFQKTMPVIVRVQSSKNRVAVMPMLYWDTAFINLGRRPTYNDWLLYRDDVDPLSAPIIDTFGGLPAELTVLDLPTNLVKAGKPDIEEATKQRVSAGVVAMADLPSDYSSWVTPESPVGMSFSYTRPEGTIVQYKYENNYPYTRLVRMTFNIEDTSAQQDTSKGFLPAYLKVWIRKGKLDAFATAEKLKRLSQEQLDAMNNNLPAYDRWGEDSRVADDFLNTDAPSDFAFDVVVDTNRSLHINPVSPGPEYNPRVQLKFARYADPGPGCMTWRAPPAFSYLDRPASRSFVYSYFSRDGQMIVAMQESPGPGTGDAPATEYNLPECNLASGSWEVVDSADDRPRYTAGLNIFFPRDKSRNVTSSKGTRGSGRYAGEYIVYSDDPVHITRGYAFKFLVFTQATTITSARSYVAQAGTIAIPLHDREAIYLGYPPWGLSPTFKTTTTSYITKKHPVQLPYWRCLKPYVTDATFATVCEGGGCPKTGGTRRKQFGPPVLDDMTCAAFTGASVWLNQCQDVEEVAINGQDVNLPPPVQHTEYVDEEKQSKVYLHCYATGLLETAFKASPEQISGMWESSSPAPLSGNVMLVSVIQNAIGKIAAVYNEDDGVDTEVDTGNLPTEGVRMFVGNALPE